MNELRFFEELEAELKRAAHGQPNRPSCRPTYGAVVGLIAVAIIAGALAVTGGNNPGPSVIGRAYAATSSHNEILFYRTTTYTPGVDRPNDYLARMYAVRQVWTTQAAVRTVGTVIIGGAPGHPRSPTLRQEIVITGQRLSSWEAKSHDRSGSLSKLVAPHLRSACSPATALTSPVCGSPLTAVREILRSHGLHMTGQITTGRRRLDELSGRTTGASVPFGQVPKMEVRLLVDAKTFVPVKLEMRSGANLLITTFSNFKRFPMTASNEKLLQMSPHPGAKIQVLPTSGRGRQGTGADRDSVKWTRASFDPR